MSATNRGAERNPDDYYQTPKWCVARLIEAFDGEFDGYSKCLEPCAGSGNIIRAFKPFQRMVIEWMAIEINEQHRKTLTEVATTVISDFRDCLLPVNYFDLCITNPPFNQAEEIIRHALDSGCAKCYAFLLRLNFLESQKRAKWLQINTPSIYVLPNRPIFGRNKQGKFGTDATAYAWFVWKNDRVEPPTVKILDTTSREEIREGIEYLKACESSEVAHLTNV